ncbi:hypothetical protein [Mucilaginibacter lappiensis]|uniref:hypothetical protein n=1 Tax=Mucilaginibacter lappiensis TaxID=354630 RepID=UPI003D1B4467
MRIKANKRKDISGLQSIAEKELAVEEKLDELIDMLARYQFDSETVKQFQRRFNQAIDDKSLNSKAIDAFKAIDSKDNISRTELLDEFSMLLLSNKIDSNISSSYLKAKRANKWILMITGIVMITLGLAIIIMPAPPDFEMFTIFYFNQDDGITLMDLISLGIIFSGIYMLIRSFYSKHGH